LYNTDAAFYFYKKYILFDSEEKTIFDILKLPTEGIVHPRYWEAFGAILVNDKGNGLHTGTDLNRHEVKSSNSHKYEYQYGVDSGEKKHQQDMSVDHIWITYSNNYKNVEVWVVKAEDVAPLMREWGESIKENGVTKKKREIRKQIGTGDDIGELVMWIVNGEQKKIPTWRVRGYNLTYN
jgi:hypothetical protein